MAEVTLVSFTTFAISANERKVTVWALYFNKARHKRYMGHKENFSVRKCACLHI